VRAFGSVGGTPRFFARGQGAWAWDADGTRYLDLVGSWGPLILGHAHPEVLAAARAAMEAGTTFGAPTELEVRLAEAVIARVPSVEQLRLVSSGTEATMSALRLARGFTGRDRVVKFAGCYHGHADSFLVKAGSGVATLGIPGSPGVTAGTVADTLIAEYNDLGSVDDLFKAHGHEIAAVIVEPVAGNMGVVPPLDGFLDGLRGLCDHHGALLIFDEVITGFRLAPGGAQERLGVTPDLTTMGKILGGGFPLGAFGGRADVMQRLAPVGPVYQAGTLSGNPVAVAAGLKTLEILGRPGSYERLEALGARLAKGLTAAAEAAGLPHCVKRAGSMCTLFLQDVQTDVRGWRQAQHADTAAYGRFFHGLLARGVYAAPAQFEAAFANLAMSEADVDLAAAAAREALAEIARSR